MVLMVQKELAENLSAEPGSKNYSPLTILVRLMADVSVDRVLPRDVFWPKPQVESAIVVINGRGRHALPVVRTFPLIRFLFTERRKALSSMLRKLPAIMGGPLSTESVAFVLEQVGLEPNIRAEALEPEQFIELDRWVAQAPERS